MPNSTPPISTSPTDTGEEQQQQPKEPEAAPEQLPTCNGASPEGDECAPKEFCDNPSRDRVTLADLK
jgi:hypothetical protein